MEATFRKATPVDADRLAAFAARTFTDTYAAHNTAEDMRDYLARAFGVEQQSGELGDPAMITVIAESGGALVGYAQLKRGKASALVAGKHPIEIYRFYVDRAAHGTGVAQRLMAETLEAAAEMGGDAVWLGVWERNPRAIAFYTKAGFQDMGTQIFQLGSDRQTDRVLCRPLST